MFLVINYLSALQPYILEDISFSLEEGELLAVLGPSGAGKSTFLKALCGLIPCKGSIYLDGKDISQLPLSKKSIGTALSGCHLFDHMTVHDNVAFAFQRGSISKAEQADRIEELLTMLEINQLANRYPIELSQGQQQRALLARLLLSKPKLLVLDELLNGLDPHTHYRVFNIMHRVLRASGITMIYVTHNLYEAQSISDYVMVLRDGRMVEWGPKKEVLKEFRASNEHEFYESYVNK